MARIRLPLTDAQRIERERTQPPIGKVPSEKLPVAVTPTQPVQLPPKPVTSAPSTPTVEKPVPVAEPSPLPNGSVSVNRKDGQVRNPKSEIPSAKTEVPAPQRPVEQVSRPTSQVSRPTSQVSRPSPAPPAREYRIQIEARRAFDANHRRYDGARAFGEVSSDYIVAKDLHRVLIGRFATMAEAKVALNKVRNAGWSDAFVALFKDGNYKGLATR